MGSSFVKEFFNRFITWYPCFRAAGMRTKACYWHTVVTYVDTEGSLPGARIDVEVGSAVIEVKRDQRDKFAMQAYAAAQH
jgi:hypothetical protein